MEQEVQKLKTTKAYLIIYAIIATILAGLFLAGFINTSNEATKLDLIIDKACDYSGMSYTCHKNVETLKGMDNNALRNI